MAVPGWLVENSLRQYPLVDSPPPRFDGGAPVPTQFIVDYGGECGDEARYAPEAHDVYLAGVSRSGRDLAITLRSTAPGLAGVDLTFRRRVDDPEWTTERAAVLVPDDYGSTAIWEGYLVTGPLDTLLAILPDGATLAGSPGLAFEPVLTRDRSMDRVRSIGCANFERVVATPPGSSSAPPPREVRAQAAGLAGEVGLAEGYNCTIRQDGGDNALKVSGAVGFGAGEPCAEFPLYPGETRPAGSVFYTGGPACSEVIASVNGQTGKVLRLVGRRGTTVLRDPDDPHAIVVRFDMRDMGSCPES